MNIIEAVKLAKKGNKIRCKWWFYQNYIFEGEKGVLYKNIGTKDIEVATFSDLEVLDDTWEILEGIA
jgi:hypothetical protein